MGLCSYNVCSLRQSSRLNDIANFCRKHSEVVGLQGTRIPAKFDDKNVSQNINEYTFIHWGYGGGRHTNKSAGVSLGFKKYMMPYIRELYSPPPACRVGGAPPDLSGREGIICLLFFTPLSTRDSLKTKKLTRNY